MQNKPTNYIEAQNTRYNQWGGNPSGNRYREGDCAEEVWSSGRGSLPYQCARKNGFGPNGLYCKNHAEKLFPSTEFVKWYRVGDFSYQPVSVLKVVGETDKMWKLSDGSKVAKTSNDFTTEREAYETALRREENKLLNAQKSVDEIKAKLATLA